MVTSYLNISRQSAENRASEQVWDYNSNGYNYFRFMVGWFGVSWPPLERVQLDNYWMIIDYGMPMESLRIEFNS